MAFRSEIASRPPAGIASRALKIEVEDRIFELRRVDTAKPQIGVARDRDFNGLANGAAKQALVLGHRVPEMDDFGAQILAPRESEQLLRQPRSLPGSALRRFDMAARRPIRSRPAFEHIEVASNHRQQVVEVVGNATSKLAHCVHLLRLSQRRLGLFPLGYLFFESQSALGNALLEGFGQPLQCLFGLLSLGDIDKHVYGADQRARRIVQRRRVGNERDPGAVGSLGDRLPCP